MKPSSLNIWKVKYKLKLARSLVYAMDYLFNGWSVVFLLRHNSNHFCTIFAPILPLYYAGGGMSINLQTGEVVAGGITPSNYQILVPVIPNTLHVHITGKQDLHVELVNPNGTTVAMWQDSTINQDYILSEVGLWKVYVSAPTPRIFSLRFILRLHSHRTRRWSILPAQYLCAH